MRYIFIFLLSFLLSGYTAEKTINNHLYTYRAKIVSVYDGDTVTANIDLGFHIWIYGEKLRLARINAPEVRGKEKKAGKKSRDWLRKKILGKIIIIQTTKRKNGKDKKGKYGRYIVELYQDEKNINDQLVKIGLAEYKDY